MESSSKRVTVASDEVIDRFLANVDVWQTIFEMLEVKDRIRLEMTNKRLGMMMLEYWKRVTSFDTQCLTWISCDPSISETRWAAVVAICVNRIGDGLRSLTISEKLFPTTVWSDNVRSIGKGCPNVETINFVLVNKYMYMNKTLDIRLDLFSRLKTLTLNNCFVYVSVSLFLSIPVSIEVIRGLTTTWEERFENAAEMEGFFADRPSLREVSLYQLKTRDESKADIFRVIAQRCPHLKSIELPHNYGSCIDYSGVVALESMKELRIYGAEFDEMKIVTICERSPLVEVLVLSFRCSFNVDLQSAALNALSALTKLRELMLSIHRADVSLVTEFVRDLARNSGASLRRLHLGHEMPLPTAAIEALANGCPKLRDVDFSVHVGEATPASIRFLIDCIVAHPGWIDQTGERTLVMHIFVIRDYRDEYEAVAANLPSGVQLYIQPYDDYECSIDC